MIQNYFKIAWRNIKKYRFYAAINILGLFTGIVFTLLIGAYVWGELQVNKTLKNADRQYLLLSDWTTPNMGIDIATLAPLAKRLKEDYPTLIENYYRFDGITSTVSKNDIILRKGIHLGDSSLLSMYDFKLLEGDVKTVLTNPYSVVITKNIALNLFGETNVVGKTITVENFNNEKHNFNITGVLKELPKNSVTNITDENSIETSIIPEIFMPTSAYTFFDRENLNDWTNIYIPSYIELKEGVAVKDLEAPIKHLIAEHASETIQKNLTVNPVLLTDFYLEKDNSTIKRMLYALSIIGSFILLMAIINFINISVSMSGSRMKEIGVRKVLGGKRKQLIFQFLTESFILVLLATILAFVAFIFLRPILRQLIGSEIPTITAFPFSAIFILPVFICLLSLLAGLYPAFVLSALKSIESLKGRLQTKNVVFQRSLVGFQFSIALLILISAFIITQQVDYFFDKDLGYNKDYILTVQAPRDWTDKGVQKMETIRSEFEKMAQITKASLSYEIPNGNHGHNFSIHRLDQPESESITMKSLTVDHHFFETYQIPITESLNTNNKAKHTISINETAAKIMGWENPSDAIGEKIKIEDGTYNYTIQNVIRDFHFDTMEQKIEPLTFFNLQTFPIYRYLNFRIKSKNIENTVALINKKWNTLIPDNAFDYKFMDDSLHTLYASEIRFKKAVYCASILSLIIVLIGIIGLVSLSVHQRIKEMGIRKVLGASVLNLMFLFIKEFIVVIAIAYLIAVPFSYLFMEKWLNNYAYHINISLPPLILPIILLTSLTFLLIVLFSYKTANANPIKSLRTE